MSSVDVIVPCYRYGHFLQECVDSVLTQTLENVRVLIIDDASPDETAQIAARLAANDPRVEVVIHEENKGHISTYNEGIERCTADYLTILSADDMLLPGSLPRAVALLDANKGTSFVYGQALVRREDGSEERSPLPAVYAGRQIISGSEFVHAIGGRNHVYTPTVLVRRNAQVVVGSYRPELPHAGDLEMWLRLAVQGSVGFIAMPQAVYRLHGSNMINDYFSTWLPDLQQRLEAIEGFFTGIGASLNDSDELYRRARRCLAEDALKVAGLMFNGGDVAMCARLQSFAAGCDPASCISLPALRLTLKRTLGASLWARVRPVAARCRADSCNRRAPVEPQYDIAQQGRAPK